MKRAFLFWLCVGIWFGLLGCGADLLIHVTASSGGAVTAEIAPMAPVEAKSTGGFDVELNLSSFPPEVLSFDADGCAYIHWLSWSIRSPGCDEGSGE